MITEQDLQEAIAECEGQRNPGANTCMKLAAFYTIKDHLFPPEEADNTLRGEFYQPMPTYGYMDAEGASTGVIDYDSGSDFAQAINGKNQKDIWPVMDELMETLAMINPRLYNGVMRKIE